jgi:hypothetical protein
MTLTDRLKFRWALTARSVRGVRCARFMGFVSFVAFAWAFAGTVGTAQAAEPPPVFGGLWDVRSLTTFDRVPAPGMQRASTAADAAADAPQPRRYRICLAEPRTLAPMMPPRMPRSAELAFDSKTVGGTYIDSLPGTPLRRVEFGYRRLGSSLFEGSQDVHGEGRVVRLQYYAQRVSADCGGLKPSAVQATGEP